MAHVRRIAVGPQTPISGLGTRRKKPYVTEPSPLSDDNKLYLEILEKYDRLLSDLRWKTGIYRVLHTEDCKKCEHDRTNDRVLLNTLSNRLDWFKKENKRLRLQNDEMAYENESLRNRVRYLEHMIDALEHSHHK